MNTAKKINGRIAAFFRDPRTKSCLISAAVFGTLAYVYLFVNNVNNNDMVVSLPKGYGTGIASGRWLLFLLGSLFEWLIGGFNVPLFNGLAAIALLAIAAAVLCRVFSLRRKGFCFALSAILVTFPAIGGAMLFTFTVQFYALAVLLTVLSCSLAQRKGIGAFCGAVVFAVLALGIYQAYFPFLAVLLLLCLALKTLRQQSTVREIIFSALRYFALLLAAYLLNQLILRGFLHAYQIQLSDYQGIAQGICLDPATLLTGAWKAFYNFYCLPTHAYLSVSQIPLLRIVIALVLILSALGWLFFRAERCWKKAVLFFLVLLLLPLAANAIPMVAPNTIVYTRMGLGLAGMFFLPLILFEHLDFRNEFAGMLLRRALVLLLLCASVCYCWLSTGNAMRIRYTNEMAANYFVTLFTRAKSLPGYREDMNIVLVGDDFDDSSYTDVWKGSPFAYGGTIGANGQINQYGRSYFTRIYLGLSFREATEQEERQYAEIIEQMAAYPSDGSLQIVDDIILVKLDSPE